MILHEQIQMLFDNKLYTNIVALVTIVSCGFRECYR
jgi:hypothetical protein